MFFFFISMSFSTEFNESIAKKIDYLVDKYEAYANKVAIRGAIESKDYGLKVTINVMDQHPVPIDVVNLTVHLMFEAELPLLEKFIETVAKCFLFCNCEHIRLVRSKRTARN